MTTGRRWLIAGLLTLATVVAGGSALAVVVAGTQPGHAPLHIGCKNHNHGPKWYAGHGRSAAGNARADGADDTAPALRSRGIAAQR